jgi:AmmeMemoRadiSam system protein B
MGSLDRPKLRPLSAHRFEHKGQLYASLEDPLGVFTDPVLVPLEAYTGLVRHFDGATALPEHQARWLRETGRELSTVELERLLARLDGAMVLDGPTYRSFRAEYVRRPVRPPAFADRSYAGKSLELRAQLARFFESGAGAPCAERPAAGSIRGVICPHIDYYRGGSVYTWAYKDLVERSDADVFVILGVAHQHCVNRFALTRKHFDTPLGLVQTDVEYVDRLASHAGADLFEDELSHRNEHSVEFQAVFLQYLLGGRRVFKVVPILVGSFHDLMEDGVDPIECKEVRRFVDALRSAEQESGKKVAYIGGIDLSHVGPEFGDPDSVDVGTLDQVHRFDHAMLGHAAAGDPAGWFKTAAGVGNRWRVCGLAATYTMLHAMGPARGRLLKYKQAVDDRRTCCVSFASLTFEADPAGLSPGVRQRV